MVQQTLVLPKSPMGVAVGYALGNRAALTRYTEAGFLAIDNNASERADRAAGGPPQTPRRTISHYLLVVAKLGGYLARAKDPPPGNLVVWRGLTRLADILLGSELHSQVVGN